LIAGVQTKVLFRLGVACSGCLLLCGCAVFDRNGGVDLRQRKLNKVFVRHYYENVVSSGNVDAIADYISPDYVYAYEGERHHLGIEGEKEHVLGVRRTYPDLRLTVGRQIAEGEWVASVVTARGTHRGVWMNMTPTNQPIEITGVNVDRVVGGRIVEHGGAANLLEPLLRIGAIKIADPVSDENNGQSD